MMNKGGFSFVAMLVINPIVILFYQNCSMSPVSYAKNHTPSQTITRQVASEAEPVTADVKKAVCSESTENKDCSKAEQKIE